MNIDKNLDLIYDLFDDLLTNEKFETIDLLLSIIDTAGDFDILLGVLTSTLPGKNELYNRTAFYQKLSQREEAKEDTLILYGL